MTADVRAAASSVLALLSSARPSAPAVHEHRELQVWGLLLLRHADSAAACSVIWQAVREQGLKL